MAHIENLNYLDCMYLINYNEFCYCTERCSTIFPLTSLSSNKNLLACCNNSDSNITREKI